MGMSGEPTSAGWSPGFWSVENISTYSMFTSRFRILTTFNSCCDECKSYEDGFNDRRFSEITMQVNRTGVFSLTAAGYWVTVHANITIDRNIYPDCGLTALTEFIFVKLLIRPSDVNSPSFRLSGGLHRICCQSVSSTALYCQCPAATVHLSLWICPPTVSISPEIQQYNWTRCSLLTDCHKKNKKKQRAASQEDGQRQFDFIRGWRGWRGWRKEEKERRSTRKKQPTGRGEVDRYRHRLRWRTRHERDKYEWIGKIRKQSHYLGCVGKPPAK